VVYLTPNLQNKISNTLNFAKPVILHPEVVWSSGFAYVAAVLPTWRSIWVGSDTVAAGPTR